VVQARGAIELRDDRGQLHAKPPFVAAAARRNRLVPPPIPPGRNAARQRLDDQHMVAGRGALEQAMEQRVARRLLELVQGERRQEQSRRRRQRRTRGVVLTGSRGEPELPIGPRRFAERPLIPIHADDRRRTNARRGPRGAARARAASEIDQEAGAIERAGQRVYDFAHQYVMQRPVEERERRTLARAIERGAFTQSAAPLHVRRRQRAQRTRDLAKRQVRELPRFERGHPCGKLFVVCRHGCGSRAFDHATQARQTRAPEAASVAGRIEKRRFEGEGTTKLSRYNRGIVFAVRSSQSCLMEVRRCDWSNSYSFSPCVR